MSNTDKKGTDQPSGNYTTQSGREVRKVGKKNISGALAQLREARDGGKQRTDQYIVSIILR